MLRTTIGLGVAAGLALVAPALRAQQHDGHTKSAAAAADCTTMHAMSGDSAGMNHAGMDHMAHMAAMRDCAARPKSAGQAAFGTIQEIVRMLEADPKTDWSKVNIEALRQHLIDMDDVVMHASVEQRNVAGGVELLVSGSGRTVGAIQRMVVNHAHALEQGADYQASASETPTGARLTVTAKNPADERMVARIRGLGFAGLMTEGDHHAAHHLAIARGDANPHAH